MPIAPEDLPIDALRGQTIDRLVMNYGHGKLSLEAFERRLDRALEANSRETLISLASDLELAVDKAYETKKQTSLGPYIESSAPRTGDSDFMVHIFGGSSRNGRWTVAARLSMINLFGGGELDFTDARFSARETRVSIWSLFGGSKIYVPENVNAVSRAICIFGGIENSTPSNDAPDAPTLIIDGFLLFSGISVKIKKTWRDQLLGFAEHIRNLFAPTQGSRS